MTFTADTMQQQGVAGHPKALDKRVAEAAFVVVG